MNFGAAGAAKNLALRFRVLDNNIVTEHEANSSNYIRMAALGC